MYGVIMKKKSRGAPPGNHNAFKHGFYSAAFRANERRVLNSLPLTDLTGEIELIRVANYRFLQALNLDDAPLDVETQLAALRAVNLSAQSITSLIRAQAIAGAAGDSALFAEILHAIQFTEADEREALSSTTVVAEPHPRPEPRRPRRKRPSPLK
jgi:hypothetical protein